MKYNLVVPLEFLSDENPVFMANCIELLQGAKEHNYIASFATSSKMKPKIVDENNKTVAELTETKPKEQQ